MTTTPAASTSPLRPGARPAFRAPGTAASTSTDPTDGFVAGSAAARPATPPRGAATARSLAQATPPSASLQQAQAIVARAHAMLSQIGGGPAPINITTAERLVSIIDATSAQLASLVTAAGPNGDPALAQFVAANQADLTTARATYAALANDITADNTTDQQVIQSTEQAVEQGNMGDMQNNEQGDAGAIQAATVGTDEGDGGDS